ncbi:tRNA threonylcarbamoyl adenosine modification protein YeaZ [Pseudoroseicyclus aestuarii]|uniref:tRNA threonylcarbamoyl adenosine modification protein YeaZ n=2 Tax=Pseudoroseicyclus aestuarii TaxID=1795041 RepID=A0A318SY65_9RHOB|nr:tRNA threonylcarbamoyl adenosine modification protein YeaZ [Pseudoroseicyclus aestuarii]
MPLLEEVLAEAGLSWGDLGAIGVGTGPGNFTGLRVAVSAARGLALGLGVPAMGVTGFEAAALDLPRPVTIALPAPRDHLWVQRLTEAGAETPQLLPASDAPEARPAPPPEALALAVARIAQGRAGTPQPRPAPFYIRAADAAPPREAPPPLIA